MPENSLAEKKNAFFARFLSEEETEAHLHIPCTLYIARVFTHTHTHTVYGYDWFVSVSPVLCKVIKRDPVI